MDIFKKLILCSISIQPIYVAGAVYLIKEQKKRAISHVKEIAVSLGIYFIRIL